MTPILLDEDLYETIHFGALSCGGIGAGLNVDIELADGSEILTPCCGQGMVMGEPEGNGPRNYMRVHVAGLTTTRNDKVVDAYLARHPGKSRMPWAAYRTAMRLVCVPTPRGGKVGV